MKKLFLAIVLVFATQSAFAQKEFIFPTAADHPKLAATGKTPEDFVPQGWEIYKKACGDLNADKMEDCVIVVNGKLEKFIQKNDFLGTDPFDTNPHILAVLLKDKDGYKLALQNNKIAAVAEGPTASYPFSEMGIKRGVLEIDFEHFMSAGGWGASNTTIKFKQINGEFQIIGADKREFMRNSGEGENRSYDFLTKKIKTVKGNMMDDNPRKVKTTWRRLPAKFKARTLATYYGQDSWEIEKDYFL